MFSVMSVRHPRKASELTTGDVLGRIYVASGVLQEPHLKVYMDISLFSASKNDLWVQESAV